MSLERKLTIILILYYFTVIFFTLLIPFFVLISSLGSCWIRKRKRLFANYVFYDSIYS